ncbi:MAG: hypothetical protein A2096_02710 [Spirochaetes bacterium GWF1_41_5]|nr:MAG: hypothetical protein A2096_02710 [Spirochaetes bacterium GWF1_41_5]
MIKIFLDSDIILDYLLDREPFSVYAEWIIQYIKDKKCEGFTTGNSYGNLFYILNDINKKKDAKSILKKLRKYINVIPTNEKIIDQALESAFSDFEDAIQYNSALDFKIEYFITRNKKDYKNCSLNILDAREFYTLICNKS